MEIEMELLQRRVIKRSVLLRSFLKLTLALLILGYPSCTGGHYKGEFAAHKGYRTEIDRNKIGKNPNGILQGKIDSERLQAARMAYFNSADGLGVELNWKDAIVSMVLKPDGKVTEWELYEKMPWLLVDRKKFPLKQDWKIKKWTISYIGERPYHD